MGYVDYVESAILESGLEETGELLELLEAATSAEDLEAIEEYLTEEKSPIDKYMDFRTRIAANAEVKAIKQRTNKIRLSTGPFDDDNQYLSYSYHTPTTSEERKEIQNALDAGDKAFDRVENMFIAGQLMGVGVILIASVKGITKIIRRINKTSKMPSTEITEQTQKLEDQIKDVAKRCEKGEITAKEARLETKKIQAQLKKLAGKVMKK